ncbi:MAG: lipid-A-disaccharide synthase [Bacteroidetes bacterium GWF2_49_14]|nr:MAG: lipid-A-disaccharide synthase [Bacteroidetes bacterium GWF2_49_14]
MRYFLIAGEKSGDQHAAGLMIRIREQDAQADFRFIGGDAMSEASGNEPLLHIDRLGFMGFTQLLGQAGRILKLFKVCHQGILEFKPDLIIPVDFGGFNLRLIRWAGIRGFRSVYYITPKIWAWMPSRGKKIARYCEKALCILPFEPDFLSRYGADSHYTGNPVVEYTEPVVKQDPGQVRKRLGLPQKEIIALLPGSRNQEIRMLLPIMAGVIPHFPAFQFVIAACDPFPDSYYQNLLPGMPATLVRGKTLELLRASRSALVTSGTATLEAALTGTPQVVCYRTSGISYLVARLLIRVKHISLVNLVLGRTCVDELIQGRLKVSTLQMSLERITAEGPRRQEILEGYREMKIRLTDRKSAEEAARIIVAAAIRT